MDLRDKPLSKRVPEAIFTAVHEAVGEASMCWNPPPGEEVFDSSHAGIVALNLCQRIGDALDAERFKARGVLFLAGMLAGAACLMIVLTLAHCHGGAGYLQD